MSLFQRTAVSWKCIRTSVAPEKNLPGSRKHHLKEMTVRNPDQRRDPRCHSTFKVWERRRSSQTQTGKEEKGTKWVGFLWRSHNRKWDRISGISKWMKRLRVGGDGGGDVGHGGVGELWRCCWRWSRWTSLWCRQWGSSRPRKFRKSKVTFKQIFINFTSGYGGFLHIKIVLFEVMITFLDIRDLRNPRMTLKSHLTMKSQALQFFNSNVCPPLRSWRHLRKAAK